MGKVTEVTGKSRKSRKSRSRFARSNNPFVATQVLTHSEHLSYQTLRNRRRTRVALEGKKSVSCFKGERRCLVDLKVKQSLQVAHPLEKKTRQARSSSRATAVQ